MFDAKVSKIVSENIPPLITAHTGLKVSRDQGVKRRLRTHNTKILLWKMVLLPNIIVYSRDTNSISISVNG